MATDFLAGAFCCTSSWRVSCLLLCAITPYAAHARLLCRGATIALDIASALAFLHDGLRVVHLDVKAAVSTVAVMTVPSLAQSACARCPPAGPCPACAPRARALPEPKLPSACALCPLGLSCPAMAAATHPAGAIEHLPPTVLLPLFPSWCRMCC